MEVKDSEKRSRSDTWEPSPSLCTSSVLSVCLVMYVFCTYVFMSLYRQACFRRCVWGVQGRGTCMWLFVQSLSCFLQQKKRVDLAEREKAWPSRRKKSSLLLLSLPHTRRVSLQVYVHLVGHFASIDGMLLSLLLASFLPSFLFSSLSDLPCFAWICLQEISRVYEKKHRDLRKLELQKKQDEIKGNQLSLQFDAVSLFLSSL